MDSQDLRNLQEAYSNVYEQRIGVPLKNASDRAAKDQLKRMIPKGEKVYTPKATLQNAAYEPEGDEIEESGLLGTLDKAARNTAGTVGGVIGREKASKTPGANLPIIGGMIKNEGERRGRQTGQQMYDKAKETVGGLLKQDYDYEIDEAWKQSKVPQSVVANQMRINKEKEANKIGSRAFSDRGGYAALKAGGGQAALKAGSSVSDVLHAGKRATQKPITFDRPQSDMMKAKANLMNAQAEKMRKEPPAKPKDDFAAGGGNAKMKATGMTRDQVIAQGKKNLANSYEPDAFDVILEYLVAEGYADTNDNALVIMANMSEEWRQTILEYGGGGGGAPNIPNAAVKAVDKLGSMFSKVAPKKPVKKQTPDGFNPHQKFN